MRAPAFLHIQRDPAVTLDLPCPPSVNALYANVPGHGRVKTERYRTWLNAAGWAIKMQRPAKIPGPYSMTMIVHRKDKRKRDLSNFVKATEDLLVAHGVVSDDSGATEIHLYWTDSGKGVRVMLSPAMPAENLIAAE